jgi:hypothetical protein
MVLSFLNENPHSSIKKISEETGALITTVEKALRRLLEKKLVHIGAYDMPMGRGTVTREFVLGPGQNCQKPKRHPKASAAIRRIRKKDRKSRAITQQSWIVNFN